MEVNGTQADFRKISDVLTHELPKLAHHPIFQHGEQIGSTLERLEATLARLETGFTRFETGLTDVQTRLTGVETGLTDVQTRLTGVETRLDEFQAEYRGNHRELNAKFHNHTTPISNRQLYQQNPHATLTPLVDMRPEYMGNQIPNFPGTVFHVMELNLAGADSILTALGLDLTGNLTIKKDRIRCAVMGS